MTMRSDLGRVRHLGSAKEGTHHWWMQRITAVALVPLSIWFIFAVLSLLGADHGEYKAWISAPYNTWLMVLLVVALFHHFQLGLQVVIEDYVHGEAVKVTMLICNKLAAILFAAISILSVLQVAFGG